MNGMAMLKLSEKVLMKAKGSVPVESGKLKESLTVQKIKKMEYGVGSNVKYGHYHIGRTGEYKNNVQRKWFFSSNAKARDLVLPKIKSLGIDKKFLKKFTSQMRTSLRKIGKKISSK